MFNRYGNIRARHPAEIRLLSAATQRADRPALRSSLSEQNLKSPAVLCEKRTMNWNMYSGCDWRRFTSPREHKYRDVRTRTHIEKRLVSPLSPWLFHSLHLPSATPVSLIVSFPEPALSHSRLVSASCRTPVPPPPYILCQSSPRLWLDCCLYFGLPCVFVPSSPALLVCIPDPPVLTLLAGPDLWLVCFLDWSSGFWNLLPQ